MSVSKSYGTNSRVQYQKCVIGMWEDYVNLSFFFFPFFFVFFFKELLLHIMDGQRHKIWQLSLFLVFFFGIEIGLGIFCKFKSSFTCESFNFSHFASLFYSLFISYIWKSKKCIPSNNHYVRIHKTSYVNFRNGRAATISSIHSMSSILPEFEQQR
jgi:hypothetical protein